QDQNWTEHAMDVDQAPSDVPATGQVFVEHHDSLATVTLSNPGKLNALSVAMWQQLTSIFQQLAADRQLRCIIVQGGGNNFAAGADITEFPTYRHDEPSVMHYHNGILAPALAAIAMCPHPV